MERRESSNNRTNVKEPTKTTKKFLGKRRIKTRNVQIRTIVIPCKDPELPRAERSSKIEIQPVYCITLSNDFYYSVQK